ncbi:uncharacterized protein DS421_13g406960 [Arachis hypogaea]|nr:uncharacterized protein DS421_13g406960 [Arachis hypogaea]
MARQAGNDGDINRLNKTSHYTRVADFERPRLLLPRRVSHTLLPLDAIVPYLAEAGFGATVSLRDFTFNNSLISDMAYHLGLRTHGTPVGGASVTLVGVVTWALVEQLLGAKPPVAPQQAVQRKESFTLKLVWLQDRVRQMPLQTSRRPSDSMPVPGVVLGLNRAGLDVPVIVFGARFGKLDRSSNRSNYWFTGLLVQPI